jgi:hypothetical protein
MKAIFDSFAVAQHERPQLFREWNRLGSLVVELQKMLYVEIQPPITDTETIEENQRSALNEFQLLSLQLNNNNNNSQMVTTHTVAASYEESTLWNRISSMLTRGLTLSDNDAITWTVDQSSGGRIFRTETQQGHQIEKRWFPNFCAFRTTHKHSNGVTTYEWSCCKLQVKHHCLVHRAKVD